MGNKWVIKWYKYQNNRFIGNQVRCLTIISFKSSDGWKVWNRKRGTRFDRHLNGYDTNAQTVFSRLAFDTACSRKLAVKIFDRMWYPLVNEQFALENHHFDNFQEVISLEMGHHFPWLCHRLPEGCTPNDSQYSYYITILLLIYASWYLQCFMNSPVVCWWKIPI